MTEKYKFENQQSYSQFIKFIDESELKGLVGSLGHSISQMYKGQELVIISNLKGPIVFLADLVREISDVKLKFDFVRIQSKGKTPKHLGTMYMSKDLDIDVYQKNVLIVEEIIDSARAISFLKERLLLSKPKSIKVATLFDKPFKRTIDFVPDLVGKQIDDQFLVGHGLDLEEYGRNLKDVYFLKYPN